MSGTGEKRLGLKILGCRGSVPVHGTDTALFGGATSSYRVDAGGEIIYLDAGSGLFSERPARGTHVTVLLSHWHADHLAGLGMFLQGSGVKADIYGPAESDGEAESLLDRMYSPPLWPVSMAKLGAKIHALPEEMSVGEVRVRTAEGCHPDGCRIIRLDFGGRSLVYATDFEADGNSDERLVSLAEGADLLLCDGQFSDEELASRKGAGHSSAAKGLEIKRRCGAGKLVIVHHGPGRSDRELELMEEAAKEKDPRLRFARQGDEY